MEKLLKFREINPNIRIVIPSLVIKGQEKLNKFAFCNKIYLHMDKDRPRVDLYNHRYEQADFLTVTDLIRIFNSIVNRDIPNLTGLSKKHKSCRRQISELVKKYRVWAPCNKSYNNVRAVTSLTHISKDGKLSILIEN